MAAPAMDISDLPVPPSSTPVDPDADISGLPAPPASIGNVPASTAAAFARAAKITRPPTPDEAATWIAHPELIPGNEPKVPISDQINALGTGINSGIADVVGLVGDTAHNATELVKAGLGAGYHELTGKDIPTALQPRDAAEDPGTSDWLKNQMRHVGLGSQIDAQGKDSFSQDLHTAGEMAGPAPLMAAGAAVETAVTKGRAIRDAFKVPAAPEPPVSSVLQPKAGQDPVESILSQPKAGGIQGPAPGASAAQPPPATVVHTANGRQHVVTSENGSTTAYIRPHGLQITDTQTAEGAQGSGEGTARIARMADAAQEQGLPLLSDTKVSPEAAKVYAKLKAAGYDVVTNPHSIDADGHLLSDTSRPVFEVRPAAPRPMQGMPTKVEVPGHGVVDFQPNPVARRIAAQYAAEHGIDYDPPTRFEPITAERGTNIANAYEAMKHDPSDPAVKSSYDALIKETKDQWDAIRKTGLKVEFMKPGQPDPYAASPRLAIMDVNKNNHLWVYPTEGTDAGSQATGAAVASQDHPLLQSAGVTVDGRKLLNNDVFRIVHDYFGHVKEGNGFRADGEYNAWRAHSAMYSPQAQGALATETLGQNAWVNFGPQREMNRGASGAKTVYAEQKAEQKAGLMPPQIWQKQPTPKATGAVEFAPPTRDGAINAPTTPEEQANRADTLRAVGLKEARRSAVTGDYNETGTDFQTSRLDNDAGNRIKAVMESERAALRNYTDRLLSETGGTGGLDQSDREARGQVLTAPVNGYIEHLDAVAQRHYQLADERAAGQSIQLSGTNDFLKQKRASFLGTTEGKQLLEGVQTRMEELGLREGGSNDGTFKPATVEQAERMRQYLNDNWTPRTSRLIGQLKSSLDEDVARAAGTDIYQESRQVRALRGTIEESKVIQKLVDPDDKLGINRNTPHESVPAMLTKQPAQQFRQYVNVLKDAAGASPELKAQSAQAIRELRAQFVNEVRAAGDSTQGMWNQKAVNQYLRDRSANMHAVFTPAEMQDFKNLNDAGNYLRMDRTYPGAAAQGHNMAVSGAIKAVEHGAAAGGALLGHIPGAIVGHAVGKGIEKIDTALLKRMAEKRIMNLEEPHRPKAGPAEPAPGASAGAAPTPITPDKQPLSTAFPGQRGGPKFVPRSPTAGEKIKALLTPEEQAQLRTDSAARMIEAFHDLPPTHELAAAALAGEAKRGWYKESAKAITNVFGPDAPRFAAVLAAMSPQVSVESNLHNALRTFVNWDKAGRPQDGATIRRIMEESSQRGAANVGNSNVLHAWVPNTIKALTHPAPESMSLSGPKVNSFMRNLQGNVNEVTLDAWMSNFAKIDPRALGGRGNLSGPGKSSTYLGYSAKVREAANILTHVTGEKWSPSEVQETVWSWAKTAYEHANSFPDGLATIPELVKNKEITDDLIRSTPDFHTLFSSPEHAGVLEDSRFSSGIHATPSKAAQPRASSKARPAAEKALQPHLLSAAKRLETLRQETNAARGGR